MSKFHRKIITGYDAIGGGIKKVTNSATPESLGGSTSVKSVLIKALSGNSDIVVIGGSDVSATPTSTPIGIPLSNSSEPIEIKVDNLSKIYIATAIDGEGASYIYYN